MSLPRIEDGPGLAHPADAGYAAVMIEPIAALCGARVALWIDRAGAWVQVAGLAGAEQLRRGEGDDPIVLVGERTMILVDRGSVLTLDYSAPLPPEAERREVAQAVQTLLAATKPPPSSEELLRSYFDYLDDPCGVVTLPEGRFRYVNPAFQEMLGFTLDDLTDKTFFELTHPDDIAASVDDVNEAQPQRPVFTTSNRFRDAEGRYHRLHFRSVILPGGELVAAVATARGPELDQRRLLEVERHLLRQLVEGSPPERVLELLVEGIEQTIVGAVGSVLLVEPEERKVLLLGAAPNLPEPVRAASDRFPIGPNRAACGTAAHTRAPVFTEDVRTDPRWEGFAPIAESCGYLACWSVPILGKDAKLYGTFAVYLPTPGQPDEDRRSLLHSYAKLAALALELGGAKAELEHRELVFEAAARSTAHAIWDWDLVHDRLRWHGGHERGFDLHHAPGQRGLEPWVARIHPDDIERVTSTLYAVNENRTDSWQETYRWRRSDGTYAWVIDRGRVLRDEHGTAIRMIGGLADDTERRSVEQRLREQAAVLDQVQSAIVVLDLYGRVTVWNRAATDLHGVDEAKALGQSAADVGLIGAADLPTALRVVAAQGRFVQDLEISRPSTAPIELRSHWRMVRDTAGHARSIVVVQTDETTRRRLHRQQLRAERLESIGTLAGGVAHDLNNVLTPILASVGLLQITLDDPAVQRSLRVVEEAAERGAGMVQQLLQFARGSDGERQPVEVDHVVREAVRYAREGLPPDIRWHLEIDDSLPQVLGDATQVHQVVMNLIVNARDAMPKGGVLRIEVSQVSVDAALVARLVGFEMDPGPAVCIQVSDTGIGIDPGLRERIFEPFFTTKSMGRGTGLGLATVTALVKGHRGGIELRSTVGEGTRFRVYLPATLHAPVVTVPDVPAVALRGRGRVVLVVDDDRAVRSIAQRILESVGFVVQPAGDGAEALTLFAQDPHRFHAVLTDVMMPTLDGPGLVHAIRRVRHDLPILAMTGLDHASVRARLIEAGAHALLPKPFTSASLIEALGRAIDG